ncbi:MAG: SPOR domain-containing protein [Bacteroidota bacterium]
MNRESFFKTEHLRKFGLLLVFCWTISFFSFAQNVITAPSYHLIVASYKSFESANNFAEVLQQKGLQAYIVFPKPGGNAYRVSIFGSVDRNLVQSYKAQVKNQYDGWIYFQDVELPPTSKGKVLNTSQEPDYPVNSRRELTSDQAAGGYMYYLILGSFDTYESAEKKANALRQNKYEPDILLPTVNNPKYRVYVYATGDKREIDAYMQRLKKVNRESGWIYEQPVEMMVFENGLPEPSFASRGQDQGTNGGAYAQPQPQKVTFNFYLIAASFKKLGQAQAFSQELIKDGFSPLILATNEQSGYYRVSVYQAYSREEVQYYANQLRKIQGRKYWIYQP